MKSNNGIFWEPLYNGLIQQDGNVMTVRSLAVENGTTTVYAGTYSGVYKTTDGGASWRASNAGISNVGVRSIAVDPLVKSTVYAGGDDRLYKTTDGGQSWNRVRSLSATAVYDIVITTGLSDDLVGGRPLKTKTLPVITKTIYVATNDGVFMSTNDAASWSKMGSGWPSHPPYKGAYALAIQDRTVFAGTARGVYRFDWQLIPRLLPEPSKVLPNPSERF